MLAGLSVVVVTFSTGYMCSRGRGAGASTSVFSATCDHSGGCSASVTAFGAEQYKAAAAIGWRRDGDRALCPEHSGAQLQLDDGMPAP